jgi:hypothetical protein
MTNILDELLEYISSQNRSVFLRKDFEHMGEYKQVGHAIKTLVKQQKIARIGHGIYAKMEKSIFSNKNVLCKSLPELAREALQQLGIGTFPSSAEKDYNSGQSTQVPTGLTIGIKSRTRRKIGYGEYCIFYEKHPRKISKKIQSII